jgi:lysozyme
MTSFMNRSLAIQIAADIIRKEEDIYKVLPDGRIQAYWDSKGKVWTIGWGNTYYQDGRAVKEGDIISRKQADDLLLYIIRQKEEAIRPYVTAKLNENQYAALIDLAYNCGEGFVRGSRLLKLINEGAPVEAIADQWDETCVTAKGTYLPVLYRRRMNELSLFTSKVKQTISDNPVTSAIISGVVLILAVYYTYRIAKAK